MSVLHVKNNTVADMTGTVTVYNSAGITQTVAATDLVRPVDWNSVHNQLLTLGGNTTGNSTVSGTNVSIMGAGGAFVGGSTNSLVISAIGQTHSSSVLAPMQGDAPTGPSSVSLGQNSVYIFPHDIKEDWLSLVHVRVPVFITNSSSAAASVQRGHTIRFGIYTRHSTNATVLTQHYSTSYTMAASHNSNASWMLSLITAIGNSTSYSTLTASSAGVNLSSSLHGQRELIMPVSSVLTPGEYWFALHNSSSSAGAAGNVLNISNLIMTQNTFNRPGQVTNVTNSGFLQHAGHGTYSTTTGALPGGISMTQINQIGTAPILFAAGGTV